MKIRQSPSIICAAFVAASVLIAQAPQPAGQAKGRGPAKSAPRDPTQSPASQPRPKSATPQIYSAEQIRAGEPLFSAQCGFCHGRDAAGGETGPDLTRSALVAEDNRGDKIGSLLRVGRPDAGMPSFKLSDAEVNSIVAFVHSQMDKFATLGGGRRAVDPADLATGNAADGQAYFNGAGGCAGCHSVTGDLAGIAARYEGLALLQRMLYPTGRPAPALPKATFTLASGQTIVAPLAGEDEFSVTILDPLGARQTYKKDAVKVKIENPLSAHLDQLGKYSDSDMHNVYAYLATLK